MENEIPERRGPGGSRPGKKTNINMGREDRHERILKDYFGEDPIFPLKMF
jgi:hypothetical protein